MIKRRARSFLAIIALAVVGGCTSTEFQEGDQDKLLRVAQLQEYGLELPHNFAIHESFKREQWFDGSIMLEYTFEAPTDPNLPYVYSTAERHPSALDAKLSYSSGNIGLPLGLGESELEIRDDLYSYGDGSRFGILKADGQPYGNYFAMHHGRTVFTVILSGFYFDDGELWAELVAPTLASIESME